MAIKEVPAYSLPVLYGNPIFWCFQALASNEFLSSKYRSVFPKMAHIHPHPPILTPNPPPTTTHSAPLPNGAGKSIGETILAQKGLHTTEDWVWYGLLANAGITVLYLLATWAAMRGIEHHEPVCADASPEEAMSSLFSAASLRQPGSARRETQHSWDGSTDGGSSVHKGMSSVVGTGADGRGPLAQSAIPEDEELKGGQRGEEEDDDNEVLSDYDDHGGSFVSCDSAPRPARVVNPAGVTFTPSSIGNSSSAPASSSVSGAVTAGTVSSLTQQTREGPGDVTSTASTTLGSAPSVHTGMRQASSYWQLQAVSAIPFVPCALSFDEVRYRVPDPKGKGGETLELLKGVSGCVTPGTMMALMGSSGAGKTTLLDVRVAGWGGLHLVSCPSVSHGLTHASPPAHPPRCWPGARRAGPSRGPSSSTAPNSTRASSRPS